MANKDKKNLYSDPILNKKFLRDLYILSDKSFSGKVTVPVLWDKKTKTIVNNESSEIMRILNSEFNKIHVNSTEIHAELKEYLSKISPHQDKIVKLIENNVGSKPIIFSSFSKDGLEDLTSALFSHCTQIND